MKKDLEFEQLKNKLYDICSKFIIESSMTEDDKIEQLQLLEVNILFSPLETIGNMISFVKQTLYPFIYNRIFLPIEKKRKLRNIKNRYDVIVNNFELMKKTPNVSMDNKKRLFSKLIDLKKDIENFKNMYPMDINSEEVPNMGNQDALSANTTFNSGGNEMVGKITDAIDQSANIIWRRHWKERCGKEVGADLNRCKARGIEKALADIMSKIRLCDNTVDPLGCKNTVSRMIEEWKKRKSEYLSKR